ncbi:MAG: RNA polymerase subunit sigma [Bacillota bacterium]
MDQDSVYRWLEPAVSGDKQARESLIAQCRPFILQEAQRVCRRFLEWGRDDELSIALIAFNEAIDAYCASKGASFEQLARLVIKRRLVDYFRRADNKPDTYLASTEVVSQAAVEEDWERTAREEEIEKYRRVLNDFNLNFKLVADAQPRHRQTRETLRCTAKILAGDQELMNYLHSSGKLPKRRLCELAKVTPRILDRGRIYVIALALLLAGEELPHLQDYARELTGKGENSR